MTFDIIITTYNRPKRVEPFVKDLLNCTLIPEKIIVVDSSEQPHQTIQQIERVVYIRTSHQNQPYQRYLGASLSKADIICFFDDDLEITDHRLFEYILHSFKGENIAGSCIAIDYHNPVSKHGMIVLGDVQNPIGKLGLWLSGVKFPEAGKITYAGITGSKPHNMQEVDFFYGPCMCFKRIHLMETLNNNILDLYEVKRGKGEDKMISMLVSKNGKLIYNPVVCLYHPAIESSYFIHLADFTAKTILSRKLLNTIFGQVKHKSRWKLTLNLWWYLMGRLLISFCTFLVTFEPNRRFKLIGIIRGIKWMLIYQIPQKYDWHKELQCDINALNEKV